jgi:hypothetical protein
MNFYFNSFNDALWYFAGESRDDQQATVRLAELGLAPCLSGRSAICRAPSELEKLLPYRRHEAVLKAATDNYAEAGLYHRGASPICIETGEHALAPL